MSTGTDDAEENIANGNVDLTSSDIEMVRDDNENMDQLVGLRFAGVAVPTGATVANVYLEFVTDEVSPGASLTIFGQDADDPATFTTTTNDVSDRTLTAASVPWVTGPWDTVGQSHQSTDISAVVQEIIDRAGWASGNAMAFIVDGVLGGRVTAESYEGVPASAATLYIQYTVDPVTDPPDTPTGLTVDVASPTALDVTWQDVVGEDSYELLWTAGGVAQTTIDLAADVTSYGHTLLTSGVEYCYQIQATNTFGSSDPSSVVCATPEDPLASGWVAYNDFRADQLPANPENVTSYTYLAVNGALKDFGTGITLPVTVTGTTGEYDPQNSGGPFAAGTDGYVAFDGIVNLDGTDELDTLSVFSTVTFDNLDPAFAYTVTLTANRDNPLYAGARYAKVTIDADAATNASSNGVVVNSNESVSFSVGYNTMNGYVAKWTDIEPGLDGSFSVTSEWDVAQGTGTENTKGYAMSAFRLEATAKGPDMVPPWQVIGAPGSYAVVSSPVTLSGTATDDVAVDRVQVEIYDRVAMQWWSDTGWQPGRHVCVGGCDAADSW